MRGCVACRRRPGLSKSREEIQPRASLFTSRLRPDGPRTAEVEEAFMARRSFGQKRRGVPGSAVGKDSDEALHRIV